MMLGAMANTASVGDMKMYTKTNGAARAAAVQKRLKAAVAIREQRRVARMRSHRPAPKLMERMG